MPDLGLAAGIIRGRQADRRHTAIDLAEARQNGDKALEAEALDYMTNVIPNFPSVIPNYPTEPVHPSIIEHNRVVAEKAALGDVAAVKNAVRFCL